MNAVVRSYRDFSAQVYRHARGRRLPTNGTIELTHRCPLACAHCYNNLPVGDSEARRRELSSAELCRIIDEITEAGCLWLLLTGGEIFARRDFTEIYQHAKRRGLLVTLFTNGTQVTEAIADMLAEWRPFAVEVTLYGRTRETYERLTGVPGSFDRCMRGVRLLADRGLPLKLKTVAVTLNRHEVPDMQRFAQEELGVEFKFDGMINARIDCSKSPLDVRLAPAEMVALDMADPARRAQWEALVSESARPVVGTRDKIYQCGGGINSFAIDPEGRMSICVLSHADTYDLRHGTFNDGWERFLTKVRDKAITRPTKCTDCHIRALCSACAATNELENGDAETPVEFFCEVAHLRAQTVGFAPPAHGDCAFCAGGAHHERLLLEATALRDGNLVTPPPARQTALKVLNGPAADAACGSGGCDSCGAGR